MRRTCEGKGCNKKIEADLTIDAPALCCNCWEKTEGKVEEQKKV